PPVGLGQYRVRCHRKHITSQLYIVALTMPAVTAEELLAALGSIDSVNPDLVPGGAGESEIAGFVAAWLRDAGLEVDVHEAAPGRPSVVGGAPRPGGGASLVLTARVDPGGGGG